MKLYDTPDKRMALLRRKGKIVTFKEPFYRGGEPYTQTIIEKIEKSKEKGVRIIGIWRSSDWYPSMEDLIKAIDWEWMEEAHGLGSVPDTPEFSSVVLERLRQGIKDNKVSLQKLAGQYGIKDKTTVKELTELAIVMRARELASGNETLREKFTHIVQLYSQQVNLSHRTSQSILLQQYSTPAPISYLAGIFCGLDKLSENNAYAFEPSAGNGLLTIAGDPSRIYVNEIGSLRNANLQTQNYFAVTKRDASQPFKEYFRKFDAVLTNPPFGKGETKKLWDTFPIKPLEHIMALIALDTMKNDGKAAIIIGGHTAWDKQGRIQEGKNRIFLNYLYSRYVVADVINIDGKNLYSRQGTSFNVRLILINGRKRVPFGAAPVFNPSHDKVVKTFDELFERVTGALPLSSSTTPMNILELEGQAVALELELLSTGLGKLQPDDFSIKQYNFYTAARKKYEFLYKLIILLESETGNYFQTYDRDAERLASLCNIPFSSYAVINDRKVYGSTIDRPTMVKATNSLQQRGYSVVAFPFSHQNGLGEPYHPASDACIVLNTQVPDSMAFETHASINKIKQEVGGDMDNFVRHRLNYPTKAALCKVLSAEQIDAVAMAIYNIEARGQGMIIGDQTGIGKGRIAAAMIRYAVNQKLQPVFLTEKANLFSDIYRDLAAIGSAHLQPFIVNNRESKTDIKDQDGNIIYTAPSPTEQKSIIDQRELPSKYDFILATYSQFNSSEKKPGKPLFLSAMAQDNIFIMDEAHNSSGSSNTGTFMQNIVGRTRGIVFLSATFAKRPDNLPIYAMKTAISDCNMTRDDLVEAITRGGVALQEVLSAQLVAEGQMIRRERSFEGVEVNYIILEEKTEEHKAIADNITGILRDIIAFQKEYVDKEVKELDKIAVAESKEVELRAGTNQAGVDNTPYFSKVFNVINQMLFSLKAEAVADLAITRLKEGKKPVIAFASTMGSFIETLENEAGMPVSDGDTITTDFAEVLKRGLDGVLRYTEKDIDGSPIYKKFSLSDFSPAAQLQYHHIIEKINRASTGITISPIDVIVRKLKAAGYTVAEVTGRKYELQLNSQSSQGVVLARKKINTNDAFRQFNNNEIDVLLINQSGSTGASAHAIPTAKVSEKEVKQRVMIVLQAELDISTEVQKRGRINRTGQILQPIYDYVTSAIPAERRLMMMLQKKLKSLDANTTSNQKQSSKILDVPDFLNKYGDKIVKEYLQDNPEVNKLLDDPLYLEQSSSDSTGVTVIDEGAMKVSGRVAVLSTAMQEDFYADIAERYNDYVDYLKQVGEYDLEVEAMDLQAETVSAKVFKMGKGTLSAFGEDSVLETIKANVLKKPFSVTELENILQESLKGEGAKLLQQKFAEEYQSQTQIRLTAMQQEVEDKYHQLITEIPDEPRIQKLSGAAKESAIEQREKELVEARQLQLQRNSKTFESRKQYMEKALNFFYIGRYVNYPQQSFSGGSDTVPAVFLGYVIDRKKKNPYTASAIKLRFAIASSSKYIALPASYNETIMAVIGASHDLPQMDMAHLLDNWDKFLKDNITDRKIRHVVTGNLLQASSDVKGKLVSYTTIDNKVKKGILLPENWEGGEELQNNVVVPIGRALPIIRSLVQGKQILTSNGLSIFRNTNGFKLIINASRSKGGDIYLDPDILELIAGNNFERTADKMVADLPDQHIGRLVEILQATHNDSITIGMHQLKDLQKQEMHARTRKHILLPPPEEEFTQEQNSDLRILELEAEALVLELELLAA